MHLQANARDHEHTYVRMYMYILAYTRAKLHASRCTTHCLHAKLQLYSSQVSCNVTAVSTPLTLAPQAFSSSEGVASSPTLSISGAMSSRPSLSSPEELQQMIMTAESTAREDDYKRYQELLVARVARDLR